MKYCKIPDCGGEAYRRGWCSKHYRNHLAVVGYRVSDTLLPIEMQRDLGMLVCKCKHPTSTEDTPEQCGRCHMLRMPDPEYVDFLRQYHLTRGIA